MPHFLPHLLDKACAWKGTENTSIGFFRLSFYRRIRHSQVQGHSKICLTYVLPSLHTLLETKGMCEVARILFQIL